jgi:hypothetical protein
MVELEESDSSAGYTSCAGINATIAPLFYPVALPERCVKWLIVSDPPGWQLFTKAACAASAKPILTATKRSLNSSNDPYGLKRLEKSRAKTPQGMMRLADKIIEEGLPRLKLEAERPKEPKYALQRCQTVDPNAYRAPFNRVRSPREERNRRPAGWTDCRFILPKVTLEGLRTIAITLAQEEQHSGWPREHLRYPKTKNYHMVEALNDYFRALGFPEFCVEEQRPAGRRVRRFVAPKD